MTFTIPAWIIYTICGIGATFLVAIILLYAYLGWVVSRRKDPS